MVELLFLIILILALFVFVLSRSRKNVPERMTGAATSNPANSAGPGRSILRDPDEPRRTSHIGFAAQAAERIFNKKTGSFVDRIVSL